mmetsp:Transcript_63022/g.186162  ORF Transcript_63022/g.186162 Transcript_63022/m.186162 type:complete len:144 (+) Transcript_63022:818-1249(+)
MNTKLHTRLPQAQIMQRLVLPTHLLYHGNRGLSNFVINRIANAPLFSGRGAVFLYLGHDPLSKDNIDYKVYLYLVEKMGTPDEVLASTIPTDATATHATKPSRYWNMIATPLEQSNLSCVCSRNSFDSFDIATAAATRNGRSN